MAKKTTPVRLEDKVVKRVRKYVRGTRQTISGFISGEIDSVMNKLEAHGTKPSATTGQIIGRE